MDLTKLWKSALADLELSVSKATYQTYFAQTKLVSFVDGVATIGLTSPLMRTLVETRYYSLVKSALDHHTKANTSLVFVIVPKEDAGKTPGLGPLFAETQQETHVPVVAIARRLHIRPEATFDSYAVSTTNQMAYAATTAIAKEPGTAYNPLFLYGGVGVGKTHLMHAVANGLLTKKPNLRVVYCMGEEFLNEIIEAIQTKTARQFKQKYRSAELLMVDDVQFIAGKQTAQEEFFHTFNAVHREGGQIILTSDRPPSEISKLEDRLRSRFEGGLMVDIAPPDFELRVAIVNIKSKAMGVRVPGDVAQLVAANITDTRGLEGFLRRIASHVATSREEITTALAASLLGTNANAVAPNIPKKRIAPQDVTDAVAQYYNIKVSALRGPKRDRPIARPRQIIMYLCKTELNLTYDDIGATLGGRDHTTIMHGVNAIARELSTNERLRNELSGIKQQLGV